MLTLGAITKPKHSSHPPGHHVLSASKADSGWTSYLPSWAPSPSRTRPSFSKNDVAGFRNPWQSWHKPTLAEKWDSLEWGEDDDGCIELAASHLTDRPLPPKPDPKKCPSFSDIDGWPNSPGAKAAQLLRIEEPDFSFPSQAKAKATWLGHAGVLVQLPSLEGPKRSRPVRCLFDPMFSARCSGSQTVGPIRSFPPPCTPEDLPEIDAVFISHNHFDHMDYESIMSIWRQNRDLVRFFVPLENGRWLRDWGISADRVVEMDWWDSVVLTHAESNTETAIKVWCTPAQHNSWRSGVDANSALWSSWCLEHIPTNGREPYRVFFAGDTGYQFHPSPSWPPSPPLGSKTEADEPEPEPATAGAEDEDDKNFPACPAFAEIRARVGPPNLLLLPISVGATFAYFRSFVPLPNWINPIPRHSAGVTAANHMPPWDAVRVMKVMTEGGFQGGEGGECGLDDASTRAVAVAMHWGTFVTDPVEVLKTLGQLEWACRRQGVRFGRSLSEPGLARSEGQDGNRDKRKTGSRNESWFVALDHGQSVCL